MGRIKELVAQLRELEHIVDYLFLLPLGVHRINNISIMISAHRITGLINISSIHYTWYITRIGPINITVQEPYDALIIPWNHTRPVFCLNSANDHVPYYNVINFSKYKERYIVIMRVLIDNLTTMRTLTYIRL